MRITIVQGAFFPVPPVRGGAVEKAWFALGRAFAAAGHQVVHFSKSHAGFPETETIGGVLHRRVPGFETPASLAVLKGLDLIYSCRVARRLPEADILVTNTFWLPMLVRRRRPGALYVHIGRYPKGQLRWYRHAARWQTVSGAIGEAILEQEPAAGEKARVIPYPLDGKEFGPAPDGSAKENVILYVGRVHPEKGLQLLLAAYEEILGLGGSEPWKLRIVGPWEHGLGGGGAAYREELRRAFPRAFSAADWVGPVFDPEALSEHYRRAAIFVYPSVAERGETFGLAPLEAMARGCATVVSGLRCFADFIEDGVTGFRFEHRAPDAAARLAALLLRLGREPQRREEAGRQGRLKAEEFKVDRVARAYLDDFASILATRK